MDEVEVLAIRLSDNSIWSNSLLKKRSAFHHCEEDSQPVKPCASNEHKDQTPHCEQTHSQGTSSANPTKVQPPNDQRKRALFEKRKQQAKNLMIRISTHDLGIATSGWTRYQMHQTGLDLNVVLIHARKVQVHSGVPRIDQHFTLLELPYESAIQDRPTITCQSS